MHCLLARWPWRRKRQPSPVLLPGKSHGQRLAGCGPWGRRKLDTTEESTTLRNHLAASSSPSVKGHSTRWAAAKTRPREGHAGSPRGGAECSREKDRAFPRPTSVNPGSRERSDRHTGRVTGRQSTHAAHTAPSKPRSTNNGLEASRWTGREQQGSGGGLYLGWLDPGSGSKQ